MITGVVPAIKHNDRIAAEAQAIIDTLEPREAERIIAFLRKVKLGEVTKKNDSGTGSRIRSAG